LALVAVLTERAITVGFTGRCALTAIVVRGVRETKLIAGTRTVLRSTALDTDTTGFVTDEATRATAIGLTVDREASPGDEIAFEGR
jgi:hypothetical protein